MSLTVHARYVTTVYNYTKTKVPSFYEQFPDTTKRINSNRESPISTDLPRVHRHSRPSDTTSVFDSPEGSSAAVKFRFRSSNSIQLAAGSVVNTPACILPASVNCRRNALKLSLTHRC